MFTAIAALEWGATILEDFSGRAQLATARQFGAMRHIGAK